VILAVLIVHLLAQAQSGVPVSTALGWFAGNISEAVEVEVGINKNHIVLQVNDNGLGLAHPKE
jgi:hypothetical protein